MFRGINAINLDSKGRMALPTRYRPRLEEDPRNQLVVTIDTEERCLLLYPYADWEVIERKIESLSSFNQDTRRIQRLLIGHATEVELDSQGRILLPPLLREYADLDKKVILVGQGKKFEIWSQLAWDARREAWLSDSNKLSHEAGAMPDALRDLSL